MFLRLQKPLTTVFTHPIAVVSISSLARRLHVANPLSGAEREDEYAILAECERDEDWDSASRSYGSLKSPPA